MIKIHTYNYNTVKETLSGTILYAPFKSRGFVYFIQGGMKMRLSLNADNIILNKKTINECDIKGKCFYRYPKLDLPRAKIDLLKKSHNIKITRNINDSDYQIISDKFVSSMCGYGWSKLYSVENAIHIMEKNADRIDKTCYNQMLMEFDFFSKSDYICFNTGYSVKIDFLESHAYNNYYYIKPIHENDYLNLLKSNNLIVDKTLNNFIYKDLHILTKAEYINARNMIKSDDAENRALVLELLANCNLNESFDYVSLLFYFYYEYIKNAKNWNNINIKTLRKALEDFIPHGGKSQGCHYEHYIKQLINNNQFTNFAFNECARYAFHNVIKKNMNTSDTSVFSLDLDIIKINPEYLGKLKDA